MTTENEQTADESGLDVDLGKVFDEVNKAEETEEAVAEQPKEEKPEVPETPPETQEDTAQEPVTEEPQEEPSEEVVAPATWTADAKEKFSGLDPAIQQEVLKREKDYAQGIQKYAESAKAAEAYDQVISPYKAMIAAEGSNPVQAIHSLFNTAYQLRSGTPEQKAELILTLAQQYGADMSRFQTSQDEDEYVDPDIKDLKDQISSLQQTTQSQMQAAQNQQLVGFQQQIQAFAADPKNEHFDTVRDSMSALLTSGAATSLEEAYEKSLYIVPEVRETIIQKQVREAEAARKKQESEAAEKAKKAAGTQLTNEAAGVVQAVEGSMEDELGAAFDKAQAS
jgi:hypothetical protein